MASPSSAFGALEILPAELRLRIYQLVLDRFDMQHGKMMYIHSHMSPQHTTGAAYRAARPEPEPAILVVSRAIRREAATIYYQHCKIIIDISQNRSSSDSSASPKGLKNAASWLDFITGPIIADPGSTLPFAHIHVEFVSAIWGQYSAMLDLLKLIVRTNSVFHIIGDERYRTWTSKERS